MDAPTTTDFKVANLIAVLTIAECGSILLEVRPLEIAVQLVALGWRWTNGEREKMVMVHVGDDGVEDWSLWLSIKVSAEMETEDGHSGAVVRWGHW